MDKKEPKPWDPQGDPTIWDTLDRMAAELPEITVGDAIAGMVRRRDEMLKDVEEVRACIDDSNYVIERLREKDPGEMVGATFAVDALKVKWITEGLINERKDGTGSNGGG